MTEVVQLRADRVEPSRLRESLWNGYMPDWTAHAECRPASLGGRGPQRPGQVWEAIWADDVGRQSDPDAYVWSADLAEVLEACAACPVRRTCLDAALEAESGAVVVDVAVPHYVSHTPACDDDYRIGDTPAGRELLADRATAVESYARWCRADECSGCIPTERRVVERDITIEHMPTGVAGGVPGPVRSHYASRPDPQAECEAWFARYAESREPPLGLAPPESVSA